MDPVRRALFLLLFASVLAAEPAHAWADALTLAETRTLPAAERTAASATATARWVRRLAVTLCRAAHPAPAIARRPDAPAPPARPALPQVAAAHATFAGHAFRLPPPTPQG